MTQPEFGNVDLGDTQSFEIDWSALDEPAVPHLHEAAVAGVISEPEVAPISLRGKTLGDLERERFELARAGQPEPASLQRSIDFLVDQREAELRSHSASTHVPAGTWFRQRVAELIFRK